MKVECFLVIFLVSINSIIQISASSETIASCDCINNEIIFNCEEYHTPEIGMDDADDDDDNQYYHPSGYFSDYFTDFAKVYCIDADDKEQLNAYLKENIESIRFNNCRMPKIQRNIFRVYKNLRSLNVSNTELESIQANDFKDAINLKELIASHNKLKEIPELSPTANSIRENNDETITGLSGLIKMDLSHNEISTIDEHAFDNLGNLKDLDLSFNPLDKLNTNTLYTFNKFENLSLTQTDLLNSDSIVESGETINE